MAQQDLIGGLFGPAPWQIRQQQMQADDAYAARMAGMGAAQRGVAGMMGGAGGLTRAGMAALGAMTPAEREAQTMQGMGAVDLEDPAAIRAKAAEMRSVAPQVAMRLAMLANQREGEIVEAQRKQAQNIKDMALAEKALRENPNIEITEEGVEGKPGWMQKIALDKATKETFKIGTPYMGNALARQSFYVGGGNEKPTYIQDEAGNVNVFQGGQLVRTVPAAGKPSASFGKNRLESEELMISLKGDLGTLKSKADRIKGHPGLERATGALGMLPSAPGSKASEVEGLIAEVSNTLKKMGLEMARQGGGIGAMTQAEWPIVEGMVANLDRTRGKQYVQEQLDKAVKEAERIYNQAIEINKTIYSQQPNAPKVRRMRFDAQGNEVTQ